MAQLDYSVNKPSNIMPGLQMLSKGIDSRQDYNRKLAAANKEKELRSKAYGVLKNGTPEDLEAFMGSSKDAQAAVKNIMAGQDEVTQRNVVNASKEILLGDAEPVETLTSYARTTMSEGGDAKSILETAREIAAAGSQEERQAKINRTREKAEMSWMIADPKGYKEYKTVKEGKAGRMPKHQKTGAFLIRNAETGKTEIAVGDYDPSTGNLKTVTGEISGEVVSKLAETATEQTERIVGQKREVKRVSGEESRASGIISRGVTAAESTATIRRGIDLLDLVKTGGYSAAALKAKQLFGIESADEGELSNSLGKAVLSQLRETFGAAFTAQEGKQLTGIEAKFGKSSEANRRLLKRALLIAEKTAKRARAAALKRKDQTTVEDIDDLLTFSLSMESPPKKEEKQPKPQLNDFLQKARTANPGVSDQDLTDYYNKKYGGL